MPCCDSGMVCQEWEADCRKEQSLSHSEVTSSAQKNTPLSAPLLAELVFHLVKNGDEIPPLLPFGKHFSILKGDIRAASL